MQVEFAFAPGEHVLICGEILGWVFECCLQTQGRKVYGVKWFHSGEIKNDYFGEETLERSSTR